MRRAGFTLIELLVVVAIIAILAAILFPVYITAKERSRQAKCFSNLKQISNGILLYAQDFESTIPPVWESPSRNWPILIGPYAGVGRNPQYRIETDIYTIFVCPTQTAFVAGTLWQKRTYGMNTYTWHDWKDYIKTIDQPRSTSRTCLVGDGMRIYTRARDPLPTNYAESIDGGDWGYYPEKPHFEGTNFAFFDGHVKWLKKYPDARAGDYNTLAYRTFWMGK